jgi:hypothetical protein
MSAAVQAGYELAAGFARMVAGAEAATFVFAQRINRAFGGSPRRLVVVTMEDGVTRAVPRP